MKIKKIQAREIFDSRGYPTIACDLILNDGVSVSSSVPSGVSCGKYEAIELRDGGTKNYYCASINRKRTKCGKHGCINA